MKTNQKPRSYIENHDALCTICYALCICPFFSNHMCGQTHKQTLRCHYMCGHTDILRVVIIYR